MAVLLLGGRTQWPLREPRHAPILHRGGRGWRVWYRQGIGGLRLVSARLALLTLDALAQGVGLTGQVVQRGARLGDTLALDAHKTGVGGEGLAQALGGGLQLALELLAQRLGELVAELAGALVELGLGAVALQREQAQAEGGDDDGGGDAGDIGGGGADDDGGADAQADGDGARTGGGDDGA